MSFLGPVTRIEGQLVRPHDIELLPEAATGAKAATVTRVTRLGFEVRVDLDVAGEEAWAQVTRGTATRLGLVAGSTVYVLARPGIGQPVTQMGARDEGVAVHNSSM
jgi:sulfate transport system ATP-binding protein